MAFAQCLFLFLGMSLGKRHMQSLNHLDVEDGTCGPVNSDAAKVISEAAATQSDFRFICSRIKADPTAEEVRAINKICSPESMFVDTMTKLKGNVVPVPVMNYFKTEFGLDYDLGRKSLCRVISDVHLDLDKDMLRPLTSKIYETYKVKLRNKYRNSYMREDVWPELAHVLKGMQRNVTAEAMSFLREHIPNYDLFKEVVMKMQASCSSGAYRVMLEESKGSVPQFGEMVKNATVAQCEEMETALSKDSLTGPVVKCASMSSDAAKEVLKPAYLSDFRFICSRIKADPTAEEVRAINKICSPESMFVDTMTKLKGNVVPVPVMNYFKTEFGLDYDLGRKSLCRVISDVHLDLDKDMLRPLTSKIYETYKVKLRNKYRNSYMREDVWPELAHVLKGMQRNVTAEAMSFLSEHIPNYDLFKEVVMKMQASCSSGAYRVMLEESKGSVPQFGEMVKNATVAQCEEMETALSKDSLTGPVVKCASMSSDAAKEVLKPAYLSDFRFICSRIKADPTAEEVRAINKICSPESMFVDTMAKLKGNVVPVPVMNYFKTEFGLDYDLGRKSLCRVISDVHLDLDKDMLRPLTSKIYETYKVKLRNKYRNSYMREDVWPELAHVLKGMQRNVTAEAMSFLSEHIPNYDLFKEVVMKMQASCSSGAYRVMLEESKGSVPQFGEMVKNATVAQCEEMETALSKDSLTGPVVKCASMSSDAAKEVLKPAYLSDFRFICSRIKADPTAEEVRAINKICSPESMFVDTMAKLKGNVVPVPVMNYFKTEFGLDYDLGRKSLCRVISDVHLDLDKDMLRPLTSKIYETYKVKLRNKYRNSYMREDVWPELAHVLKGMQRNVTAEAMSFLSEHIPNYDLFKEVVMKMQASCSSGAYRVMLEESKGSVPQFGEMVKNATVAQCEEMETALSKDSLTGPVVKCASMSSDAAKEVLKPAYLSDFRFICSRIKADPTAEEVRTINKICSPESMFVDTMAKLKGNVVPVPVMNYFKTEFGLDYDLGRKSLCRVISDVHLDLDKDMLQPLTSKIYETYKVKLRNKYRNSYMREDVWPELAHVLKGMQRNVTAEAMSFLSERIPNYDLFKEVVMKMQASCSSGAYRVMLEESKGSIPKFGEMVKNATVAQCEEMETALSKDSLTGSVVKCASMSSDAASIVLESADSVSDFRFICSRIKADPTAEEVRTINKICSPESMFVDTMTKLKGNVVPVPVMNYFKTEFGLDYDLGRKSLCRVISDVHLDLDKDMLRPLTSKIYETYKVKLRNKYRNSYMREDVWPELAHVLKGMQRNVTAEAMNFLSEHIPNYDLFKEVVMKMQTSCSSGAYRVMLEESKGSIPKFGEMVKNATVAQCEEIEKSFMMAT